MEGGFQQYTPTRLWRQQVIAVVTVLLNCCNIIEAMLQEWAESSARCWFQAVPDGLPAWTSDQPSLSVSLKTRGKFCILYATVGIERAKRQS